MALPLPINCSALQCAGLVLAVLTLLWLLARYIVIARDAAKHTTARIRFAAAPPLPPARDRVVNTSSRIAVVTGAQGLVGAHVVNVLARKGYYRVIRAVDVHGRRDDVTCRNGVCVQFRVADVTDWEAVCRVTEGAEAVFHVAALVDIRRGRAVEAALMHANDFGTEVMLHVAQLVGVVRFVYVSSTAAVFRPSLPLLAAAANGTPLTESVLASPTGDTTSQISAYGRCVGPGRGVDWGGELCAASDSQPPTGSTVSA